VIVAAFKTKTPFIIDSLVRAMTVMVAVAAVGLAMAAIGVEAVSSLVLALAFVSPLPVVYLSLKQGERNRGPMPPLS
jgi:hypothetical protein